MLYYFSFFFFNDTATTEIYTLSLHDALPISATARAWRAVPHWRRRLYRSRAARARSGSRQTDRKSTRLNSSHANISYAVFCLKKKKKTTIHVQITYSEIYHTPLFLRALMTLL